MTQSEAARTSQVEQAYSEKRGAKKAGSQCTSPDEKLHDIHRCRWFSQEILRRDMLLQAARENDGCQS